MGPVFFALLVYFSDVFIGGNIHFEFPAAELPHTNTQSFYFSLSPTSPYLTPNPLVLQLIIILFDTRGQRKTMHAYKIINDVTSGAM